MDVPDRIPAVRIRKVNEARVPVATEVVVRTDFADQASAECVPLGTVPEVALAIVSAQRTPAEQIAMESAAPPRDTAGAMSQANVESVSRLVDHINRTGELGPDFDSVIHPEIEFKDEIGAYTTREELRDFLKGFAEAIGGLHVEIEETRDLGDLIMLMVQQSGQGFARSG